MKITLEVEVDLYDWSKQKRMYLREEVGMLDGGKGHKFKISRPVGGLSLQVQHEGSHREAMVDLAPLAKAMAAAIEKHAKKIDAEKAAA